MRRFFVFTMILLFPLLTIHTGFAQANNGSVGGVVQDATTALIPGVTVTLTNTETGVVDTRLSNESGAYSFPSVQPGTYKLSGDLSGFTADVRTGLQVGTAAQMRIDLTLRVGAAPGTQVSVSVPVDNSQLRESSASVGEVLNNEKIHALPVVGGNVLDLLTVLPGFRTSAFGAAFDTVGGLGLDTVNATINGLSTNSARDAAGGIFGSGYQVLTTTVVNPDLVGEIRLILAPVDAELGRGNAQVQIQTRSGTNKYTGSAVWNIQNSAMDANTWTNNHTPTLLNGAQISNKTVPNWQNRNQITGSYGGPIIKNKTFFFVLYDYQNVNGRALQTNTVYTPSAKQGIWRYYPGWNSLNAAPNNAVSACVTTANPATTVYTGNNIVVDTLGNPLASLPNAQCGGPPVTLQCFSIFGNQKYDYKNNSLVPLDPAADCPGGTFVPGPNNALQTWDLRRPGPDPTGYISRILKLMPEANNYGIFGSGDGLNTAANRYLRTRSGSNSLTGTAYSATDQNNRRQMNVKIDHTVNHNNRVSFQWTYEWDDGIGTAGAAPWEFGYQGNVRRRPQVLTVNGTSTINPNLVNEARFGLNYSSEWQSPAWNNQNNPGTTETAKSFLLQGSANAVNGKVYPIIFNPGATAGGYINFGTADVGNTTPLWDYADTLRWSYGKHSFSFGGEYRRPMTTGYNSSGYVTSGPGNPGGAPAQDLNSTSQFTAELPFFNQTTRTASVSLLNLLSGSVGTASTPYWIDGYPDLSKGTWQDTTTEKDAIPTGDKNYGHQSRKQVSNEWSFFAKDDYKILKGLTLNLGLRYDLNMSPYLDKGLTNRLLDDGAGLYGPTRPLTGDLLANWLIPGDISTGNGLYLSNYGNVAGGPVCALGVANPAGIPTSNCDPNLRSQIEFVGPGTPNPKATLIPQNGQFSPAIGFAWQVPWFGEGKTTMRGGFQRTYGGAGSNFSGGLLSGPGGGDFFNAGINTADPTISSILTSGGPAGVGRALNLADLPLLVPGIPTRAPADPLPFVSTGVGFGGTGITYSMYSTDYVTPYTDNFTLSITRSLNSNYTVDLRFVDTLGRKQSGTAGALSSAGSLNLNMVNVYHNPELYNALVATRAGLNDPLFDQMLMGLNLNSTVAGYGAVGTTVNSAVTINGATTTVPILQRGSAQIRRLPATAGALANGDFATVMQNLYNFATAGTGLQAVPSGVASMNGRVLRNGCDRIANGLTTGFAVPSGPVITPRCFAENYLVTNPTFGAASYAANFGHSNYQSGQLQFTARPIQGVSIQGTYSLSKTMALPGNGYTDPLNRQLDYGSSNSSVGQEFRSNAVIELPIGPNKLIFGNSSGWVARAIEHWQTSFIYVLPEGTVRTIVGPNTLYANGRPNIVGPWTNPKGKVEWNGANGNYFGEVNSIGSYAQFLDPQCTDTTLVQQAPTSIATSDPGGFNLAASNCTLRGLGQVVPTGTPGSVVNNAGTSVLPLLVTPLPGQQGNLGTNTMNTVARWTLDASASKTFRITESKSVAVRIDTTNVLNHPTPGDPTGLAGLNSLSSTTPNFGQITTKTGSRSFQASLRLSF